MMKEITIIIGNEVDWETQEELTKMFKLLCDNVGTDGIDCFERNIKREIRRGVGLMNEITKERVKEAIKYAFPNRPNNKGVDIHLRMLEKELGL